jgi:hypothetical protein
VKIAGIERGDKNMAKVRQHLIEVWGLVRELMGENAYARYCDYVARRGGQPLGPQEFYVSELQRKYSRPSRCC